MKLSDNSCRRAKPKEKAYKLADGLGMYLEIMPNGSKYWRLKYRIDNKEKRISFGVYPEVKWQPFKGHIFYQSSYCFQTQLELGIRWSNVL